MASDLEQLARWRTIGARHSDEVIKLARKVLKGGKLGEQEWAVREQLAIAALDHGRINLANLVVLEKQFKGSPRVALLQGLKCEAQGETEKAKKVYEGLLAQDETNVSAHQRLIALTLSNPNNTIPLLLKYLDIFYTDPAGWSLLAELYADQGLYAQSLTALGHVLVIQSWDSNATCRAGETAYTMGDYQLALKYFLRTLEMQTDSNHLDSSTKKTRAWWGVKLSVARLMDNDRGETAVPAEQLTSAFQLKRLDELATERLLAAGGSGMSIRRAVLAPSADVKR